PRHVSQTLYCSHSYALPALFYPSFFFNATASTEIYTLSLHDALPISRRCGWRWRRLPSCSSPSRKCRGTHSPTLPPPLAPHYQPDRKSTRLNSSHVKISYAVFCLKKKKTELGGTVGSHSDDDARYVHK